MMYEKPQVGDLVTVTTRYKSTVLGNDFDTTMYKNQYILESEKYDRPNTIRIPCAARHMEVRVIELKNVVKLVVNGRIADPIDGDYFIRTVKIPGSKPGTSYSVTIEGDDGTCTCVGYGFRKQCRHIGEALDKIKSGVDLN